uniref:Cap-specific mRNA (nucleoside-2'-O-)-methyltransferase 1 n=1 Tax=Leptobrachium leishanense TaxID=445787 RepID=A0A8C5MK83_9ANUR
MAASGARTSWNREDTGNPRSNAGATGAGPGRPGGGVKMKRKGDTESPSSIPSKQKRFEELGLNLSSTSDDDTQYSTHGTQESSTSGTGSDSESDEKRPVFGSTIKDGGSDPLTAGTSSQFPMYNSISQKLMAKMGYREGEGLGKFNQGRKEIVEASNQKGRRGLGLTLKGFEKDMNINWRDEPEATAYEEVDWFPECTTGIPHADELSDWMETGPRKMIIDDETVFCQERLLRSLLECKSSFDELEGDEMRRARTRSNPYETIRGVFFLNRAAMKMANIDHVFDYMFTNPKDAQGRPKLRDKDSDLLYFADVCAGPGGFSEYVLWRKKWHAKGFGMTLKGPNDFKLEDFYSAPSEIFEPYYGEEGVDGDGDVTRPENIAAFRNFVLDNTDGKGVHFMMADGGFSVEGQENIQEILSKQLMLCQFLVGLFVVRTGGHFICKTFDLFTPFSVGLIYLLYCCFDRICLFKPVTSRPANSERYIVGRGLKDGIDDVRSYLFTVNRRLNQLRKTDQDVNLVVPLQVLRGDRQFFDYMVRSNERNCEVQVKALAKIHAFVQESTLNEPRQADIRKQCLKLWGIPDQARVAPTNTDAKTKFFHLIQSRDIDVFNSKPTILTEKLLEKLSHVMDYRCMVSGGAPTFLLGLGVRMPCRNLFIYCRNPPPGERYRVLITAAPSPPIDALSLCAPCKLCVHASRHFSFLQMCSCCASLCSCTSLCSCCTSLCSCCTSLCSCCTSLCSCCTSLCSCCCSLCSCCCSLCSCCCSLCLCCCSLCLCCCSQCLCCCSPCLCCCSPVLVPLLPRARGAPPPCSCRSCSPVLHRTEGILRRCESVRGDVWASAERLSDVGK